MFAHGAGAGMRHAFMEAAAQRLAAHRIASLRYQFPYVERGRKSPDRPPVLVGTVRAAVAEAARLASGLPLFAGGKSMGGRMTSTAAAERPLDGVRGLVFFGFPLHPAGRPGTERGAHLAEVGLPMLFLQGTRDSLADLELLRPLLGRVRLRPTLHVIEDADHGFHVRKRSGRTDEDVLEEMCATAAAWCLSLAEGA
ncbi:MAG TPA: alpha/beta family hydrolase [Longimicrobiales bacterium]|nr:alpha/beta family hydrolase [Longimicrobiales bacterium]